MLNMGVKPLAPVRKPELQVTRTRFIGLRVTERDAETLARLAEQEGVGLSTFARLVLETYIREHGRDATPPTKKGVA